MKTQTSQPFARKLFCLFFIAFSLVVSAQDTTANNASVSATSNKSFSKSRVFVGSQIPVQLTAGYGYQFSNRLAIQSYAGLITKPYGGFIVNAMEAFGMDKYLAQVIKKSFKSGTVLGLGPNYLFGKNYFGIYGQYMHLKGGGVTPADALSVYFKKDFTQFDVAGPPLFEFSLQSNLMNVGALFGRSFQLRNPRISINGEISLSKIVASKNSFASNRSFVDQTAYAKNLYKELDSEMRDAYRKHGFIPTINVYLAYRL
ncbi:MAG TPA: hypothetical protein VM935_12280 [Chitinophagaceae bacterium]|nr:hypothetical protein [Chitinophagaceae bacterium]